MCLVRVGYLILQVEVLVPLVRHGVVGVTNISRVLPVHYRAGVLLHTCWLVRGVFVLRYAGPVNICLGIVNNLLGVVRGCVIKIVCFTQAGWNILADGSKYSFSQKIDLYSSLGRPLLAKYASIGPVKMSRSCSGRESVTLQRKY